MPLYRCQNCQFPSVSNVLLVCPKCRVQKPTWVESKQGFPSSPVMTTPMSVAPQKIDYDKPLQSMKLKLPQAINQDPIAVEIQKIINEKLDPGSQTDARLMFEMFVFLSHNASDLIKLLENGGIDEKESSRGIGPPLFRKRDCSRR